LGAPHFSQTEIPLTAIAWCDLRMFFFALEVFFLGTAILPSYLYLLLDCFQNSKIINNATETD
jgi:hypothetical protein